MGGGGKGWGVGGMKICKWLGREGGREGGGREGGGREG